MAEIRLEGVDKVRSMLAALGGELEGANKYAQNKMAYELMVAERAELKDSIDSPTPYSVSSIVYKKHGVPSVVVGGKTLAIPGTKGAGVFVSDRPGSLGLATPDDYLGVQILGGAASGPKRSEKLLQSYGIMPRGYVWVPTNWAKLDRYGNISGSVMSKILSDIGLNQYGRTKESKKGYRLLGRDESGYSVGVAKKVGTKWVPWLWFVPRPTGYEKTFDFYYRAELEVNSKFPGILDAYVTKALQRVAR
jgi:hypothetical protein